ncbi:MAG: hypothetical protein IKV31_02920 [Paludibacteraceae bacterium]|nr:hypothetical protein [Paludibacteraceae bacterium]
MKKFTLFLFAMFCSALSFAALNPYAYGLKSKLSDDEKTVTITYKLNAPATAVNVVIMDGETVLATQPSTGITQGEHSVDISTDGFPKGKTLKWKVEVKGTSVAAPTEHSKNHSFYHPSSIDIDNNPENETFGLLLVNDAMQKVKNATTHADGSTYVASGFGAGIFAFNPAFELIPNGDDPGYNGGITFTTTRADGTGTAYAPRRIRISDDGRIFVTSLNTDGNYLWEVNPKNMNEWTPVFQGTSLNANKEVLDASGNFIVGPNCGFDVIGSKDGLRLMMYSVNLAGIKSATMSGFKCAEYNLGENTTWNKTPSKIWINGIYAVSYTGTQIVYDKDGGIWMASNRGTTKDSQPGLVHYNAEGVEDYKALLNNANNAAIRFDKDFSRLIIAGVKEGTATSKKATVYTISKDASGKPILTQDVVIDMKTVGTQLNDFAFDYAGNLYACGNSSEKLVAWAMPYSGTISTPCPSKHTFSLTAPAQLNPFAYNLWSELSADEKNLTIKYSLNAKATSVEWVLMNGNNVVKTVDLASLGLEKGDYTETISTTDFPQCKKLTWKIEVKGVAVSEPTEYPVSYDFYHPSSVDIDNNPENATFGLILCNEAMQSVKGKKQTDTGEDYLSSSLGAGIYAFNPAFENTGKYNGGIEFTTTRADGTGTAYAPRRIRISNDGRIFVTSLNTDGNYLWEVNPMNLNEWTPVFKGTLNSNKELVDAGGNFVAAPNVGFDVRGEGANLKLLMLSSNLRGFPSTYAVAAFKCHEYNLGTATTWNSAPSNKILSGKYMINYTGDQVAYDAEGGVWFCQHQGTAKEDYPSLVHINKNGVEDYKEVVNNRMAGGFRFNNDFTKVVIAGIADGTKNSKKATIYAVSKDASGNPVLTQEAVIDMATLGNNLNDFAWDYAGNLYGVSNSNEKLAVWAMPHSSEDAVATPAASKYAFSIGKYSMIVNTNDENKGTVTGTGEYKVGETATLTATAKEGYKLLYWSDRSTENPRTITMNKNEALSAYFVKEYDEEQTFTITKVWENTNVPETNTNGYQAVGWDEKVYLQASADSKIKVYSNSEDAPTEYATSGAGYQIAVDEAGNMIVFNATFYVANPNAILIYKKGSTEATPVSFTLLQPGRCDFFSASGNIYSEEGGYVYFYCNTTKVVNRLKIKNGAATAADVTTDVVGGSLVDGCTQNHVVVDIFGNLLAQSRLNGVRAVNVHTDEAKSFFLPEHKTNTLGGCSFELGGKEFWAYNVGTKAYTSEWKLYNITDKTFLSETTLYAKNTTETNKNQAANWLNVQVVDENTAYIYQYCPTVAVALWKVSRDIKYNVSATAENGTVTGAGKYKEGTTATLTATPNARYDFVNWTKGGIEVSTDATYSFEVTEDVELVANFSKKPDIAYELNGGQWNKYGWTSKKDMYDAFVVDWKEYSNSVQYFCPYETQLGIGNSNQGLPTAILGTQDILGFMAQEKWAWLGEFLDALATAQGKETMPTAATTQMRFALGNFFGEDNNNATSWVGAVDCSAGQADPDAFQPTWGHLLSNPTQPTTTMELGNPYREGHDFGGWYETADFTGAAVTTIDENTVGTFYAKWNLVIDEDADNNSTVLAPYEGESVTVTVKRNFEPNKCYTLTLPFDMNASQIEDVFGNATVYEFYNLVEHNAEELYLEFIPTSSIQAGEPCLLVTPAGSFDANDGFTVEDVIISTTSQPVQVGSVTMMPVLDNGYLMDDPSEYYVWNGGLYCAGTYSMTSKGLRAYFVSSSPLPVRARVVLQDNEATSIPLVGVETGTQVRKIMKDGQIIIIRGEEQYNIQGQRME